MTKPNEPTLTCSEVVERLAQIAEECYHGPRDHGCPHGKQIAQDIREQAPAILHSWRERRVQELEDCLRKIQMQYDNAGNWLIAEKALAKSEQIRKGANHE